jgi:hypothetical protein
MNNFYVLTKQELKQLLMAQAKYEMEITDSTIKESLNGTGYETLDAFIEGELMQEYDTVEHFNSKLRYIENLYTKGEDDYD